MAPFRETIKEIASGLKSCEEWLELVRELQEPILVPEPTPGVIQRWAGKDDLFAINALEGFVKETEFLEESLDRGDRCLILEHEEELCAFAWVTFCDYRLALWYTLKLPKGWSYLVFIYVHPSFRRQGLGKVLLGALMMWLRDSGYRALVAGMYSNWEASLRLHTTMGFRIRRRLTQCKLLHLLPYPPKEEIVSTASH